MTNIFKPIKDFPNYLIDIYGNVYSKNRKRLLATNKNSSGYLRVHVWRNSKPKHLFQHIEVVKLFGDRNGQPYQNDLTIDHLDKDRTNCFIGNLELVSFEENIRRRDLKEEFVIDENFNLDDIF